MRAEEAEARRAARGSVLITRPVPTALSARQNRWKAVPSANTCEKALSVCDMTAAGGEPASDAGGPSICAADW